MKKTTYDERQLNIRGKVFRNGFFILVIYLVADGILRLFDINWSDSFSSIWIGIMLTVTICSIHLIITDAYEGNNENIYTTLAIIMSIAAIVSIMFGIESLSRNGFITDNQITRAARTFIIGVLIAMICVTYWIKKFKDNKQL